MSARQELARAEAEAARLRTFNQRLVFAGTAALVLALLAAWLGWQAVLEKRHAEMLQLRAEEATRRVLHAVTFTEQKLIDRGAGGLVPKSDEVPAGRLSLVITNIRHVRQRWTESPDRPLEGLPGT